MEIKTKLGRGDLSQVSIGEIFDQKKIADRIFNAISEENTIQTVRDRIATQFFTRTPE